ncbi:MAG TPA: hypothetical protein PLO43_02950, partial [Chlamydiales bacterium]|nr:hypothetical protein [Chlamydiales bacterium]
KESYSLSIATIIPVLFILFVFTALTSSISLMEMLVSNLMENFNFNRKKAVVFTALGAFILGIPSAFSGSGLLFGQWKLIYGRDFFETMDFITSNWFMPIAGFLTTVFVGWVIDKQLTKAEFEAGTKLVRWYRPWFFMVRYVAPLVVAVIILQQAGIIRV